MTTSSKNNNKIKIIIKRIVVALLITVLAISVATVGINMYMINSTEDQIVSDIDTQTEEPECIIVLGARVYSDGTLTSILKKRLDKAIELYNEGVSDKIIMSGDNGTNEYNEVIPMREYAISQGVPEDDIYLDYAGFSTYESMYRLRDIFQVDNAVVVTQQYHLYRALYIGNRLGLEVTGFPAEDVEGGQAKREVREVLARVKSMWLTMTGSKPTYLGDTVSLSTPQEIK